MAFFRVTVTLNNGEVHTGIREYETSVVRDARTIFLHKAFVAYGNVKSVEAVLLADDDPESIEYAAKRVPPVVINIPPQEVPVTFNHEGKDYKGSLGYVNGAAAHVWHLMIDDYYCGRLRIAQGKWVFDPTPKTESFTQLAAFFGKRIMEAQ